MRDETVIVDMEAGLEHFGRGTAGGVDAFIVVVEPGKRSFETAHAVVKLAKDIGQFTSLIYYTRCKRHQGCIALIRDYP